MTMQQDAARYKFLIDKCSYRYAMSHDGPLETGIQFHVQPLDAESQYKSLEDFIDEAMKAGDSK